MIAASPYEIFVPGPPAIADLHSVGESMESASPQDILRWAVAAYGPGLTMATAFGAEGCVLMAMLAEIDAPVHVFNLDTGYQFPETLETRDRIRRKYGIDVELVSSIESVREMENRFGGPIYGSNPGECCRLRKIEPLKRALVGKTAWISAIRRDQTIHRAQAEIVEWDKKFGLVKVSPLANWTKKDVWRYIFENEVPYNPLHDRGYPSIGCWPCTRAVGEGEGDRDGRWAGTDRQECGLHDR